jgi:predicted ester cyclase
VARGTHDGVYFDLPPTGRAFELHGISIYRFGGGKIAEIDEMFDRISFMKQLGVSSAALN